ncbi:hypothetical protein A3K93_07205 [Acinetobacter sp. NCu2D-2]|uniref:MFS transporter n=1 Tax=Acinetobacter sp. NCu2D-2 TaxID=1608473 RepID=UPI0007CDD72E|nr:MFS transporter [Acinetobacter sp. NCu2D-2]ANF82005.1 hypothetical protein A3K93_07205 [Acinetobacter sp. NCu2D-2]
MPKVQWIAKDLWIIAAGFAAAMHVGKLPAAIPVLQAELGLSLVQSGLLLSCIQCCGMFFALLIGSNNDKIGLKNCILLGLSLLSLGSIIAGLTQSVIALFATRVIEGIGFLLITLSGPALIRHLVPTTSLSAKMGLWTAYMGGGMGIALISAPFLIEQLSWSAVWFGYAFCTLIVLAGLALYIPAPDKHPSSVKVKHLILQTIKHPPAWCLALIFFSYSGQWLALVGFLPTIYANNQISPTLAGVMTATVSVTNAIGTFICGLMLQRGISAKKIFIQSFIVLALCTSIFYSFTTELHYLIQFVIAFLFSLVGGFIAACVFTQALEHAPNPMAISTTVGLILQLSAISQFMMPPLVAFVVTQTASWAFASAIMALFSAFGILLCVLLYRWVSKKQIKDAVLSS